MGVSLVQLIRQRMEDLNIKRSELARRMGYANTAKGCLRIDRLCDGDLRLAEELDRALRVEPASVSIGDKRMDGNFGTQFGVTWRFIPPKEQLT